MTPATDQWDQLKFLFDQAAALAPPQRDEFLRQACGGNQALQDRVHRMLETEQREGFLDAPVHPSAAPAEPTGTLVGGQIGRYKLVRLIASGGMGTVYEAQQDHPRRMVALKLMHQSAISPSSMRRFEAEADILGRLRHQAIAQVHDAGVLQSDDGPQPYFAMELIDGLTITGYATRHQLGTRQRLALLEKVCHGVQHAHSHGVIHRDLKPANILVDRAGEPKILDFGIARMVSADGQPTTLRTGLGQLLGTLPYMSPEQVAGDPAQIDARTDVYALGVIAYELLTGRLPHDVRTTPIPEAVRAIREDDPTPLSAVNKVFRGDLDTIVAKALEKEPSRRYQTASELAADIHRYLTEQPVLARAPSAAYQLRKFARRNKALVSGVAAVIIVLSLGVIGTTIGLLRAESAAAAQRRLAERAAIAEADALNKLQQTVQLLLQLQFAYEELSDVPGATRTRESLALQTITGLRRAETDGGYGELSRLAAYAHQRMGEVQLVMGKTPAALQSFRTSLDLWVQEADRHPNERDVLRTFAVSHWKMGEALAVLGRFEEARRFLTTSFDILDRLDKGAPSSDPFNDHYVAASHRRLAEIEACDDHHEIAQTNFKKAIEHYDRVLAAFPQNWPSYEGKAMALHGLARAAMALGQTDAALEALDGSLRVLEQLAEESGKTSLFARAHRAQCLSTKAAAHMALHDHADAIESARQANEVAQTLADADPVNFQSQHLAAKCRAALGRALLAVDPSQARDHIALAIAHLERLAQLDPDNALLRQDLASTKSLH